MQKKKKKNKLFIFLIICFVLVPFLLTKGCNYIESLNQAKNSVSEPITSISEQIQPSARVYTHAHTPARTHSRPHNAGAYEHERAHTRVHNAHVYAQMHSISKANWSGTAVPDSGYVEKVYFNINLSDEEIMTLIDNLTFYNVPNYSEMYIISVNEDMSKYLGIVITGYNSGLPFYYDIMYNGQTLFAYNSDIKTITRFNSPTELEIGYNNQLNYFLNQLGGTNQNNKLKSLFSITPFKDISNSELSIANLFKQLGNAIIIFGGAVVNVFISMEPIFWNEGPTLIFILLIASVSFALVFWGIELLISLVGVSRTKRKKKK